ncbi:hypothetical protein B0J13DRAFT_560589 [Dactylonectria estremocensis]|uniref:Alpha/beta hydrolase domain-containing protein n=1 Tax=Dactylonectria estremocensis TaxID=1079267 RepID=A0A9P9IW57_9HYPO|nr:hypothetical protein B0J13DRAFT_560589 [Dactylonectria estremocensis]
MLFFIAADIRGAGHAWMEVDSQAPSALGKIKRVNPARYKDMHFIPGPLSDEFQDTIPFVASATKESLHDAYDSFKAQWWPATTQSPEIIAQASHALRSGDLSLTARRVVLTGLSQTGGLTRRFITHSSHLRLPNGNLPLDAFVPCQSGGDALPDVPGAKIIELLGESEFLSVRLPCGVSGQMRDTKHRRPESDGFRLYEIAGMAHRESRYASEIDLERWAVAELHGAKWSTFSNSFIYHAVFESVERWTSEPAIPPPSSSVLHTIDQSDEIFRDEHGNATGGVRTVHTEAPLARLVAATPKGRPNEAGSEWPFDHQKLRDLYESVANYRLVAGLAIQQQVKSGFLLPADAETLRRETIENVKF